MNVQVASAAREISSPKGEMIVVRRGGSAHAPLQVVNQFRGAHHHPVQVVSHRAGLTYGLDRIRARQTLKPGDYQLHAHCGKASMVITVRVL
jgi:hypothetical protein